MATIEATPFGSVNGNEVTAFKLTNDEGIEVTAITYGCAITSIKTPDQNGRLGDIVLGFDDLEGYLQSPYYFGCVIGRCANRIANNQFELDGKTYHLKSSYKHHLHGGDSGFDKKNWTGRPFQNEHGVGVDFHYLSPDGEEGYPGNLDVTIRYYLVAGALIITYLASTDQPTIVNLTNHSYFNLDGGESYILHHALFINSEYYLPIDADRIPTGSIDPVANTPFNFYDTKYVNDAFQWSNPQIKIAQGLDHSFALNHPPSEIGSAAALYGPGSRRSLEVHTDAPAIHVFTGNSIEGTGKGQIPIRPYTGIALETQYFPDAPHNINFPSIVVRPEKNYTSTTIYKFGVMR